MAASDKAGVRSGARGRRGRMPRQKAMLLWDPESTVPEFKQIKPTSVSGRSVTQASFRDLPDVGLGKVTFKFSSGTKRPSK